MHLAFLLMLIVLTACSSMEKSAANNSTASNALVWADGQSWLPYNLPGKKRTLFSKSMVDGRDAVRADAQSSVSMLRQQIRIPADQLRTLRFSWKVPALINNADMTAREGDDSPVRIVLAFEGDRSAWSTKNAMLSELTRAITGEELPYATLMYVWCNQCTTGSVIYNPRTDRIRKIAIESGVNNLNQWRDYEQNIKADFERAFGEAPGALLGIALMTDTDNTQSQVQAYYGPVSWTADAASASR